MSQFLSERLLLVTIRLPMRALQKNNYEPCTCKGRKSVSVGSVCKYVRRVLVRVTSQLFPTATAATPPETFLRARLFCFLKRAIF